MHGSWPLRAETILTSLHICACHDLPGPDPSPPSNFTPYTLVFGTSLSSGVFLTPLTSFTCMSDLSDFISYVLT